MNRTHRAALALSFLFSSPLTVLAVPVITSTKDDATAAATRKVAGDNIDYTIQIANTGADPATGVTLTDPTPANTTLVPASVNVSPLAFDDTYVAVGNTTLRVGNPAATTGPSTSNATKVTANDTEFLGDTFTISSFQAASANGGTVAMVTTGADAGSFSYLPPAGFEGVDTFTYTITDDGSTGFPALTGTGTVTITVTDVVWYVDDSAAAGGTGRSNAPLQTLATLNVTATDPDEADDYIFVYSGNYSGAFTLEAGQRLIGEPAGLTVGGLAIAAGGTRPAFTHNAGNNLTLSTNNTVRSMNFTNTNGGGITGSAVGTLTLSDFDVTVTNGTALNLTTSGTVTATGTDNDVASTTGVALNVANVSIGGAGLTFKSIAASGATSGIALNATGGTGLTVTGTDGGDAGTEPDAGSGGTITNTTGDGVALTNANNVSLGGMTISNAGRHGVNVSDGNNLTLFGTQVTNAGNADEEHGLNILNTTGTVALNRVTFNGAAEDLVRVQTTGGITLNVTNASQFEFPVSVGPNAGNAFELAPSGSGAIATTIQDSFFDNIRGDSVNLGAITLNANGAQSLNFTNNDIDVTLAGRASGVAVSGQELTVSSLTIHNNNFSGAGGNGVINLDCNDASTVTGNVTDNVIASPPGIGINVQVDEAGTSRIRLNNNTITNSGGDGIITVNFGSPTQPALVSTMDMIITNNTVTNSGLNINQAFVGGISFTGFEDNNRIVMRGNNVTGTVPYPGQLNRTDYYIEEVGGNTTFEEVPNTAATTLDANYLRSINVDPDGGGAGQASVTIFGFISLTNGTSIPQPLFFAPGAGESAPKVPVKMGGPPVVAGILPAASKDGETFFAPDAAADQGLLKLSDLDALVSAAIARWEASELTSGQMQAMQRVTFTVEELPGVYLGQASGDRITLDANAAGNRWFIDRTPGEDSEFSGSGTRLAATANGGAADRVDALTTIVHELGHAVGLDDSYLEADGDGIMYGFLHLSERRLPRSGEAEGAQVHNHYGKPHTHYLAAPITIGTLPPNKTVTVVYRTTVNAGITAPSVSNQGTISGTNFANVSTDDLPQPGGAANPTVTVIEVPPVVSNFARSTAEDTVLNFTAANFTGAYTDANSDALTTVRITSLPANGTLKLVAANVTLNQDIPAAQLGNLNYTPNGNYNGADSFNWNASDGVLFAVAGGTVNLTVTEVNDPPTATADPQPNVAEDAAPIVIVASSLTTNDSKGPANESTQTLTVTAVSAPVGGTVNLAAGNITFTLTPDFNGAASFTYTVTDNGTTNGAAAPLTANGTVSFTVTEVNDAPVAVDDTRPNVAEDAAPIVFAASTLATNDTKGAANESAQTLTVTEVNNPTGGTVVLNAGNITFTLTPNYNGPASFEYTVADNGTTNGAADPKTDVGLVSFTVTSVNDDPLAAADTIQRYPTQSVKVPKATLLSNDTDGDGGTPAFVSVSAASANGGTVTSDATQVFYTPAVGFTGTDTFTYTINDGQGGTAVGTVNVAIIPDESAGMSVAKVETLGDGSVRVTFAGIPGRTYRVQSSETMAPGSWTDRLSIAADAQGRFQFTDPPPLPPTRFYRSVQP